ncbi:plasminogen receptor (KT)-like [Ptychodera flava]|uniref:plasminogen receptor (KT)-like n=1 Tax=Ptychodera flava TaxID=63121 RepID=UPI00396A7E0E
MGNPMTKVMDENMVKSQEFMLKTQRMTMERQLMMQNVMRERQMAMQIARARDLFYWWGSFYGVCLLGMTAGALKGKNPRLLAPLVPLTFILGYQYDLSYGTKIARMKDEAESILKDELSLLDLPDGIPTVEAIDKAREALKSK